MYKNQNGFGLVPAILIFVIAGIIAGTGYYVWNANNNAKKSLDNAAGTSQIAQRANNASSAKKSIKTSETLEVKELGVKIPVDNELKQLSYDTVEDSLINVNSMKLDKQFKQDCFYLEGKSTIGVYAVRKVEGKYTKSDGIADLIRQFDTFYLEGWTLQTECNKSTDPTKPVSNSEYDTESHRLSNKVLAAFKESEEI